MRLNPLLAVLAVGAGLLAAPAYADTPVVVHKTATLPEIGVSDFQNTLLPGSVADDRGVLLGGIGSGLFPLGANEYWTMTDRGPNGEVGDARTFLVPGFTPTLVRVKMQEPNLVVREAIPITTPGGESVTGLANLPIAGDPLPYAADAATVLPYNPNGLDTEGVVRTPDGHFWLVDEYGPSIVETDAQGHVLNRHLPAGLEDDYLAAGVSYRSAALSPPGCRPGEPTVALRTSRCYRTATRSSLAYRARWW